MAVRRGQPTITTRVSFKVFWEKETVSLHTVEPLCDYFREVVSPGTDKTHETHCIFRLRMFVTARDARDPVCSERRFLDVVKRDLTHLNLDSSTAQWDQCQNGIPLSKFLHIQTITGNRKIRMVQLLASSAAKRSLSHHLFNSLHLRCLRHILGLPCRDRAPFSSVLEATDCCTNNVFLRPARCLWPRKPCIDYLAVWQCPFIDGSVLCGNSQFVLWLCQECRCELSCIFDIISESRIFERELFKSFDMVMFD